MLRKLTFVLNTQYAQQVKDVLEVMEVGNTKCIFITKNRYCITVYEQGNVLDVELATVLNDNTYCNLQKTEFKEWQEALYYICKLIGQEQE